MFSLNNLKTWVGEMALLRIQQIWLPNSHKNKKGNIHTEGSKEHAVSCKSLYPCLQNGHVGREWKEFVLSSFEITSPATEPQRRMKLQDTDIFCTCFQSLISLSCHFDWHCAISGIERLHQHVPIYHKQCGQ